MKKGLTVLAVILLFVSFFVRQVEAQEQVSEIPKRYVVGIGAAFYKVEPSISAFSGRRNGQEIRFNNESERFTGSVFFNRILENSPAEKAGLESGDILLEVDGEHISFLGVSGAIKKMASKSVGDGVDLKVRQTDEVGNVLREFNVNVVLEVIDRADWVPQDIWFRSELSTCSINDIGKWNNKMLSFLTIGLIKRDKCSYDIEFATMVSEDEKTGKFTYRYKISNTQGKTVMVRLQAIDVVSVSTSNLVELDRGATKEFTLVTDAFPVEFGSRLDVHEKPEKWLIDFEEKNGFFVSDRGYWAGLASSTVTAFVPAYHLQLYRDIMAR